MPLTLPHHVRWSFAIKIGLAAGLVALADLLFWDHGAGSVIGVFALLWALSSMIAQRAVRRNRAAMLMAGIAGALGLVLAFEPSLIGWVLFWSALSVAVLLPRAAAFGDAWVWARRLLLHGITSLMGPLMDWLRTRAVRRRTGRIQLLRHAPILILPLVGGAVFLALFALANPIISDALSQINLPTVDDDLIIRSLFWGVMTVTVWSSLRPRRLRLRLKPLQDSMPGDVPGVTLASVTVSLILFNLMFAVQNGLDIAYLWSGAGLPKGVTLAQYAHQGAYPLIVTALLAGLFVLMTTHPKSRMAQSGLVRALVSLWVGQNVFLVASSILRTLDYIEVYSLTVLRISALLWMGLVALGLILIAVRMLRGKSLGWLVNANSAAALTLLSGCSAIDLGGIAARWNVTHAREVNGKGAELDLCYLNSLDGAALFPLIELEMKLPDTPFKIQVGRVRSEITSRLIEQQAVWQAATIRDQLRLDARPSGLPQLSYDPRMCDGSSADLGYPAYPGPTPTATQAPAPLTPERNP
jgi:Domain of unknown function (DUF4173)